MSKDQAVQHAILESTKRREIWIVEEEDKSPHKPSYRILPQKEFWMRCDHWSGYAETHRAIWPEER